MSDPGPTGVDGVLYSFFPNVVVSEALPRSAAVAMADSMVLFNSNAAIKMLWGAYLSDAGLFAEIDTFGPLYVQAETLSGANVRFDTDTFVADDKRPVGVCFLDSTGLTSIVFQDPRGFVKSGGEWSPPTIVESDEASSSVPLFWFPPWLESTVIMSKSRDGGESLKRTILIFSVDDVSSDSRNDGEGMLGWWPKGKQILPFEPTTESRLCHNTKRCVAHAFPSYFLVTNEHARAIDADDIDVLVTSAQRIWDAVKKSSTSEAAPSVLRPRKADMKHGDAYYYYVAGGAGDVWDEMGRPGESVVEKLVERMKSLAREYLLRIANEFHSKLLENNMSFFRRDTSLWTKACEMNGNNMYLLRNHVHPLSKLVGTFYAQPQCDADFVVMDTRRGWTNRFNAIQVKPTKGMLTVFPPWMPHQVKQVDCGRKLRIAFAANWEKRQPSETLHPWEYTACGTRTCFVHDPYAYVSKITKKVLWDEPLETAEEDCRKRTSSDDEL
eukprot:g3150.t1